MGTIREWYELFWTNPGSSTPRRHHSCMGTCLSISKTIQVRRTRQAGYCWRGKRWTHKWRYSYGSPTNSKNFFYISTVDDTCMLLGTYLPGAIGDWVKERERVVVLRDLPREMRERGREFGKYVLSARLDDTYMMAQSWAESTWDITNYGRFINQFPLNIIRSIRLFERINKKVSRQIISVMFNQIYIYRERDRQRETLRRINTCRTAFPLKCPQF